jgi:3-phosphoshikimate 1-carboxyvinyltransferase
VSGRGPIRGSVTVPGDKSISHRTVLFAGLAEGKSRVRGFLNAEDTLRTVGMMRALGATVEQVSPAELRIVGAGLRGLAEPVDVLDAGNSGTTIRIGSGLLAAQPFLSVVTGDRYLRQRPMARVIDPLTRMGAKIWGREGNRLPPLCIRGGGLKGIRYEMPVASAQVKSALLLAGLYADSAVSVVETFPTRDHTERMLSAMGAKVVREAGAVTVSPAERLDPLDVVVPGDISSAAFFLVLAAVSPGSELTLHGVGVNPFRTGAVEVLRRMRADIRTTNQRTECGEPVADLVVRGAPLRATRVAPEEVPGLIDEVPALCVAAAFAEGRTEIRGAGELRVKESDRIDAMVANLSRLGVECGEFPDGLWINGPASLRVAGPLTSRGDHRIAMSLRVLGKAASIDLVVEDTACIGTSFPGFEAMLEGIGR